MSAVTGIVRDMNGADWFEFGWHGLRAVSRKAAAWVLIALVACSGGRVVTWYVEEQAESRQEATKNALDRLLETLPTPTFTIPTPSAP